MDSNWIYSNERLALRGDVLQTLLEEFGSELLEDGRPVYSTMSIYECAHDWVSQGNPSVDGVLEYYEDYYAADGKNHEKDN